MRLLVAALALSVAHPAQAAAADYPKPLPEEPVPATALLPAVYPESWILVHDLHFGSILDGRVDVVDTASTAQPLKGIVRAAQFASHLYSRDKHEIYTAETFYSRLTRGERTDAITIWDTATLQPKGEIVLPGGKRYQAVTYSGTFQFTNGERWALVSNFTPAQSVTVVDLDGRKVLNEIDLPGCTFIYPTGTRGFTTFCADGSMTSLVLDAEGKVASSKTVDGVQDIDKQPMFAMPAMVGKTAWFVTYYGQIHGFDLSGDTAKALPNVASVGTAEGGDPEWRPGGWQVIASDPSGRLYVLMSPHGREGSHKDGGSEVWVIDPVKNVRVMRIPLHGTGFSIAVTREAAPHLIVARPDGVIDVYDAATGAFVHSLGASVAVSPVTFTVVP
ncbi:MAG: amine dehydrogenase [Sphingomonadales bacterium]|nr:amine dehydrogenase [Sphingomonadales bacterium]MDE2568816.1 amine dehydrogenase [Sphingomonadales bacterium]